MGVNADNGLKDGEECMVLCQGIRSRRPGRRRSDRKLRVGRIGCKERQYMRFWRVFVCEDILSFESVTIPKGREKD